LFRPDYVSQIVSRRSSRQQVRQAHDLTTEALEALRRLTVEPRLQEAHDLDTCDIADLVVSVFEQETGRSVTRDWNGARGQDNGIASDAVGDVLLPVLRLCGSVSSEGRITVSAVRLGAGLRLIVDCTLSPGRDGAEVATRLPVAGTGKPCAELQRLRDLAVKSGCSLSWSVEAGSFRILADFVNDAAT